MTTPYTGKVYAGFEPAKDTAFPVGALPFFCSVCCEQAAQAYDSEAPFAPRRGQAHAK